jgi:hypothetical protein
MNSILLMILAFLLPAVAGAGELSGVAGSVTPLDLTQLFSSS